MGCPTPVVRAPTLQRRTSVVTSGSTAVEFARQLVVLGGVVRPRMHSLLGHLTDRALRSMATSVVVTVDSGKFDLVAPALVFGPDEVDFIVTDSDARADEPCRSKGSYRAVSQPRAHTRRGGSEVIDARTGRRIRTGRPLGPASGATLIVNLRQGR